MFDSSAILQLYASVLEEDIIRNRIYESHIRLGVKDMADTYRPDPYALTKQVEDRSFTDFSIPAFRCAYLHKFAPLHTYIVLDVMKALLNKDVLLFKDIFNPVNGFKLCCLGGGPGSDAVGVLAALNAAFTGFKSSVTIIDSIEQWEQTFNQIVNHLRDAAFGKSWNFDNTDFNYIGADLLLDNITDAVKEAIGSASLITMVKFITAATCTDTERMVERTFSIMKPGSLVLYIDNDVLRYTRLMERVGRRCDFKTVAGPLRHIEYTNEELKTDRFRSRSCYSTKVTMLVMQKPDGNANKTESPSQPSCSNQTVSASATRSTLQHDVRNVNNNQSKTQNPSQLECSILKVSASVMKSPLDDDAQNLNKYQNKTENPSLPGHSTQNITEPLMEIHLRDDVQIVNKDRSKTGNPSQPDCFNQNIAALVMKSSLQNDVQNLYKISSQPKCSVQTVATSVPLRDDVNVSNNQNKTGSLLQPNCSSHSISAPVMKSPLWNDAEKTDELPDTQTVSSSCDFPESIDTPLVKQASHTEIKDNSDNACCSCCVIS